jgi:hypothetical protein
MEIFLLLLDEFDDAAATARMLLPRLLGLLLACGAFATSIAAAIHWPNMALIVLTSALLAALLPAPRIKLFPRFKTDP